MSGQIEATNASVAAVPGLNFYVSEKRAAILSWIAPLFYHQWWLWQLFQFARREGFPRTRSYRWYLVPIYGWVVLFRQFDDLRSAARTLPGGGFSSILAIWLVIASGFVRGTWYQTPTLATVLVLTGALLAAATWLVQRSANAYLASRYPRAQPHQITRGEFFAALAGILVWGVLLLASQSPAADEVR
jgi:hypothetical protein